MKSRRAYGQTNRNVKVGQMCVAQGKLEENDISS